ncbi:hypothetical protein BDV98DRAFT_557258 [Pterulicium gracile]|uniref:Uncharacterized protein n=1 Tax=Pterulicium gracile TaxID=1884261 RepID=A0A5C3QYK7_9AGAR|nr:hypothetical protein BDV98DRAFT_557258 [Pterula gracilis]
MGFQFFLCQAACGQYVDPAYILKLKEVQQGASITAGNRASSCIPRRDSIADSPDLPHLAFS